MKEYGRKPYMTDNYERLIKKVPQKAIFDVLQKYGRFEKQSSFKKPFLETSYEEMEEFRTNPIPYVPDPYDDANFPPLDSIIVDQPEDTWDEFEEATEPAIPARWVQRFDNTFWESYSGASWTGSVWAFADPEEEAECELTPIGNWAYRYRPTKIKLTLSGGGDPYIAVVDKKTWILDEGFISSGAHLPLTFHGRDIERLQLQNLSDPNMTVTNIEFYET